MVFRYLSLLLYYCITCFPFPNSIHYLIFSTSSIQVSFPLFADCPLSNSTSLAFYVKPSFILSYIPLWAAIPSISFVTVLPIPFSHFS